MKLRILIIAILTLLLNACATIPKETVDLSKVLGNDLVVLHNSHRNMVGIYYDKITDDINTFIDDVYAPFVIHYVLKAELEKYGNGEESLYGTIETAGKTEGKAEADNALNMMTEFIEDANYQINKKRTELVNPIIKQKRELLNSIDQSYENAIYANSTITGYLESIRKVKESQQEALRLIGLEGKDEDLDNILLQASDIVNTAIEKGKEIDIKSDDAFDKINELSNQIKNITNQKNK
ncbi:hypothetical protein [uncultured Draconibacterium sp.]|uniref:hypothetical protein n=1 Tax=uncultured Draconibacterium sp. TaxID=1573823 RepID=UPI0029C94991|nr:hypothetical protein [uncultured Draconibacterium sp.]